MGSIQEDIEQRLNEIMGKETLGQRIGNRIYRGLERFSGKLDRLCTEATEQEKEAFARIAHDETYAHYKKAPSERAARRFAWGALNASVPIAIGAGLGYLLGGEEAARNTAAIFSAVTIPAVAISAYKDIKKDIFGDVEKTEKSAYTSLIARNNWMKKAKLKHEAFIYTGAAALRVAIFSGLALGIEKLTGAKIDYLAVNGTAMAITLAAPVIEIFTNRRFKRKLERTVQEIDSAKKTN